MTFYLEKMPEASAAFNDFECTVFPEMHMALVKCFS